ncbi:RNA polymerase-binding protein RbpA, partial [Embleya sp. NPDC005575]|uniref:RNA polymerase-binding protein RbpA n=1 Tax=Embleya sp. NPDC005575 TaxID=3156892 RepID=UPI0033B3AF8B
MGEAERGEAAPRLRISFWCANKHETQPSFATDAQVPETWDCPRCGLPAGQDQHNQQPFQTGPVHPAPHTPPNVDPNPDHTSNPA